MKRIRLLTGLLLLVGVSFIALSSYSSQGLAASRPATALYNRRFPLCRTRLPAGPAIDWAAVGRALGKPLMPQMNGGMYAALLVRQDLHVVAQGVPVKSEMGIASELSFMPIGGGRAYVMGELTVTDTELNAVTQALTDGGLSLTSMHKHLPAETPRIWWVHFAGYAEPVAMAGTIRRALQQTGTPANSDPVPMEKMSFNTKDLDQVMGLKGQVVGGVYKYLLAHAGSYRDTLAHLQLSPMMQPTAALYFQPLGGSQAAINGDMIMTANEIDGVTKVFRQHDIELVALHSHMTQEYPQLYYLHYWKTGDALALGRALRAALDGLAVRQAEQAGVRGN